MCQQSRWPRKADRKKPQVLWTWGLSYLRGGRDSKAGQSVSPGEPSRALVSEDGAFGLRAVPPDEPTCILVSRSCTNVPNEAFSDGDTPANQVETIDAALAEARRAWTDAHDARALRRALLDLVRRLDEEKAGRTPRRW